MNAKCVERGGQSKGREEATLGKGNAMGETLQETVDAVLRSTRSVDYCLSFPFVSKISQRPAVNDAHIGIAHVSSTTHIDPVGSVGGSSDWIK